MPTDAAAAALLDAAWHLGIRWLDTARAYGVSEARIGEHQGARPMGQRFRVATKLTAEVVPSGPHASGVRRRLIDSWARSRAALACRRLDTLMVHRAPHLRHPAVRSFLEDLRHRGLVTRIGVSVRSPGEFRAALADRLVRHVQLPFNLLDDRWLSPGIQRALARRSDIIVHARSAFLQGLLLMNDHDRWPPIPGVDPAAVGERLDRLVAETARRDRIDLCLAYVRAQPWISGVVVGAETPGQLTEIVDRFRQPSLDSEQIALVRRHLGRSPPDLLDPATWRRYRPQASPRASTTRPTSSSVSPT